jgi:hypothetical protein
MVKMPILSAAVWLALSATLAESHDHWINHGDYQDPVYHWRCCGDHDCTPIEPSAVKMDAQGNYVLPDGATVEKSRMIPSEDQWDYVCRWGSDTGEAHTRCLFVVAPGT